MAYSEPFSGHFKRGLGTFSVGGFVAKETENRPTERPEGKKKEKSRIKPTAKEIFSFS